MKLLLCFLRRLLRVFRRTSTPPVHPLHWERGWRDEEDERAEMIRDMNDRYHQKHGGFVP